MKTIDKDKEYYFVVSLFIGKKSLVSKDIKVRCYIINTDEYHTTIEYNDPITDELRFKIVKNEELHLLNPTT